MIDATNRLLLAALQRAGKALDSGGILDAAVGLGLSEGWSNQDLPLNRQSVATRLTKMVDDGILIVAGQVRDALARRETPTYEPTEGWNPQAPVPIPPRSADRKAASAKAKQSPFADYDKRELLVIVEGQDQIIQSYRRMQDLIGLGMKDVSETVEKVLARFVAEGLR